MRMFLFGLLAPLFTVTAVASAESVQAPVVPRETIVAKHRPMFRADVPPVIDYTRRYVIWGALEQGECPEWAGLAYDIGWPAEQIPKLLRIIHRESRCLPEACSESDSGRVCRDWGLTQINEYSWRRTIENQGMVMRDMWNPELNLRFALWLYQYSEERNGDGWQPWNIPPK